MTNTSHELVQSEVLTASQNWINSFNQGKTDKCVATYTTHAVMQAKPMGTFVGRDAISEFWTPFIASGATDLEYHDVNIKILDESTALLSANWSMNVGRGIITKEKWVKQGNGSWLLEEDDFEVLEQFKNE